MAGRCLNVITGLDPSWSLQSNALAACALTTPGVDPDWSLLTFEKFDCGVACSTNKCNACEVPIPDTLYVTLSGQTGNFAPANGTHTVPWSINCTWTLPISGTTLAVTLSYLANFWTIVVLDSVDSSTNTFIGPNTPCNPATPGGAGGGGGGYEPGTPGGGTTTVDEVEPTSAPTAAPTSPPTVPPTIAPTSPIINTCNTCDPKIPDTITATFSGLGGSFAVANGVQELDWVGGCTWENLTGVPGYYIVLTYSVGRWRVELQSAVSGPLCSKSWVGSAALCDIDDTYAEDLCNDDDCSPSCALSVGATCVVST
jgi:hypothetical protein